MSTAAIIELALVLLPKIEVGITEFVRWINTLRSVAKQNMDWTPEQEAAWRNALLNAGLSPEELPDA